MIRHDGVVHNPLGAASYYFGKNLMGYLNTQCTHRRIILHIGTQPNCSPHIGNITTFSMAFALASALKLEFSREVMVKLIYVDSAPAVGKDKITINDIRYQRSLEYTGDFHANQATFTQVIDRFSSLSNVPYEVETQNFWRSSAVFPAILQDIINRRDMLSPLISPGTHKLAIRAACPHTACGLADKHGINNRYCEGRITFLCPNHGEFSVDLASPRDVERLEFNTPLRNLIRVLICSQDPNVSWILCTGSDYAGFYQEQLLWRLLDHKSNVPLIFYAPLILDWSGSKLSKSMYVEHGAYKYLRDAGLEYMLEADAFFNIRGGPEALFAEVQAWVAAPYKLFRGYSIEYLHKQLIARGMQVHRCITESDRH
ncbi:hypothetical protein V8E54_002379 [Elaphomyces granulatus]